MNLLHLTIMVTFVFRFCIHSYLENTYQLIFIFICRSHQMYYMFGFLFLVFLILIITCSEATILLCYFHLCAEVSTGIIFIGISWRANLKKVWLTRISRIRRAFNDFKYEINFYHNRITTGGGAPSWLVVSRGCTSLSTVSTTLCPSWRSPDLCRHSSTLDTHSSWSSSSSYWQVCTFLSPVKLKASVL